MSSGAAIWARVSTAGQHTANQLTELRAWAEQLGGEVVAEYVTEDSAWYQGNGGSAKGKEFEAKRAAMLAGVRGGQHPVVLVWAIDRLSRRGSEDMQRYLRLLAEAGADVRSKHDPWLNTADPFAREILIGVFATLAKYESQRRSERIRAGLARRRAEGKPVGRKAGAKDKTKRRRSGYVASWEDGGGHREALKRRGQA
jgi:DNA invertase Pin-like site-specific DNA recombinase